MIIGNSLEVQDIAKLDTGRMDQILQVALDEISANPIIDERIRQDPVIMAELSKAVQRGVSSRRLAFDHSQIVQDAEGGQAPLKRR